VLYFDRIHLISDMGPAVGLLVWAETGYCTRSAKSPIEPSNVPCPYTTVEATLSTQSWISLVNSKDFNHGEACCLRVGITDEAILFHEASELLVRALKESVIY